MEIREGVCDACQRETRVVEREYISVDEPHQILRVWLCAGCSTGRLHVVNPLPMKRVTVYIEKRDNNGN